MPITRRRNLPPIEELTEETFQSENKYIDLSDEDFDEKPVSEVGEENVIVEPPPVSLKDFQEDFDEEETTETKPKKEKFNLFKKKNKDRNTNKPKRKNKKTGLILSILGILFVSIIAFVILGLLFKNKSNSADENKTDVSVSFNREEFGGIVFDIDAKKDVSVNVQRLYQEKDGTIVFCETGELDIVKGKQEGFLECLNATEEVKNTGNKTKLIKDNVIIKKEE